MRFPATIDRRLIGNSACPNLFTAELLEAEQGIVADGDVVEGPAEAEALTDDKGGGGSLPDVYVPPLFWAVSTPEELQDALQAGPTHILITAHLDMTTVPGLPDEPQKNATLNNAVGRLSNTTFSIAVRSRDLNCLSRHCSCVLK